MFTIKYREFHPCAQQPSNGPTYYDSVEQLHGPFELVSQEVQDGEIVVHAHRSAEAPGMTFGPHQPAEIAAQSPAPRPTLWVMNAQGSTVATYNL